MEKELLLKYGGYGDTMMHPVVIGALTLATILIFILPRRHVIVPFLAMVLLVPIYQEIVIAGLNFFVVRILVFAAWIRLIARQEIRPIGFNAIDRTVILLAISGMVVFSLLWGTWGAFVNRLGHVYDLLGSYFLMRLLMEDFEDVLTAIKALVVLAIPIAVIMVIEFATGNNLLSFLGTPDLAGIREGRFRSQGPFANPITAGTFGAVLLPLAAVLWWGKGASDRKLAAAGVICTTLIAWTSTSSGPIFTYMASIIALFMWRYRENMRLVRWSFLFVIVCLHIAMKAPVWALIARVQYFGSSMSYHRFLLIDQFIKRVNDWWLMGTKFTSDWALGMWDLTNQYIMTGANGGMVTLVLFVALIVFCFQSIGRAIREAEDGFETQVMLWGVGAALFSHAVAFMGISYFDQISTVWYVMIAMIAVIRNIRFGESDEESKRQVA